MCLEAGTAPSPAGSSGCAKRAQPEWNNLHQDVQPGTSTGFHPVWSWFFFNCIWDEAFL